MSQPKSFGTPSGAGLIADLQELITQRRQLDAKIISVVGAMHSEHLAAAVGYSSLPALVCAATRISPTSAQRLVARAQAVTETVTPTGHVTPAPLPRVRELVAEGVVDGEHVDAIMHTMAELPESAPVEVRELVEQTLADTARVSTPRVVRLHGRRLVERLDQDGTAPTDDTTATGNTLHLRRTRDGGCQFRGRLTQTATEGLLSLLNPLAKPQTPLPGIPDPRTEAERNGDGLADIVHLALTGGSAPTQGGEKPHLNLVINATDFLAGTGAATTDSGSILSPAAVLREACDGKVIRVMLDNNSVPLDLGRAHRVVSPGQREALIVRDQGCAFPGCHLPARWTDAHHIIHWKDGGRTDLDNLVLLCRRHHTLLHQSHWHIHMIDRIPHFQPPRWIDPEQKLIRNILRQ